MEWVETTGSSLEEATERALEALGVGIDDAEIEVVTDAKMGLFGRVRSEARIRARVRPTLPRARTERRSPRRRPREARSPDTGTRPSRQSRTPAVAGAPPDPTAESGGDGVCRPADESMSRRAVADTGKGTEMATEEELSEQERTDLDDSADVVRRFLDGLLDHLELDGTVDVELTEAGTLVASISGQGLGLLVGPRGTTLNAVQDLARAALPRTADGAGPRLTVDVGDYLSRRSKALAEFARKLAAEVIQTGDAKHLEAMSASDRKTVHDAINGIDGVTTRSEGEEPGRHVVIVRATS